jgi:hypothetical protein
VLNKVTATTLKPYEWLKQIPTALLKEDEIPLIGKSPEFPWEMLSKGISEVFDCKDFNLSHSPFEWRTKEDLYKDLSQKITPLSVLFQP